MSYKLQQRLLKGKYIGGAEAFIFFGTKGWRFFFFFFPLTPYQESGKLARLNWEHLHATWQIDFFVNWFLSLVVCISLYSRVHGTKSVFIQNWELRDRTVARFGREYCTGQAYEAKNNKVSLIHEALGDSQGMTLPRVRSQSQEGRQILDSLWRKGWKCEGNCLEELSKKRQACFLHLFFGFWD